MIVAFAYCVCSQSCEVLVAGPVAQILGGLRVKQEPIARRFLLWSQEVTFDKRWNTHAQFQGFCQIGAMRDVLPCGSCLEHPKITHVIFLHIWKMLLIKPCLCFVRSSEQILFYKALTSRLMGRGDSYFFCCFFLLISKAFYWKIATSCNRNCKFVSHMPPQSRQLAW